MVEKTLIDYYSVDYPALVRKIPEAEGGGWIAEIIELPGCMADGETPDEAMLNLNEAKKCWIDVALKRGQDIPVPSPSFMDEEVYSGKFTLRIPKFLHRQLAQTAKNEGVSLNQYIQTLIAFNFGKKIEQNNMKQEKAHTSVNYNIQVQQFGYHNPRGAFNEDLNRLWSGISRKPIKFDSNSKGVIFNE